MKEYRHVVEHLKFAQQGIPPEVVRLQPTVSDIYHQLEVRLGSAVLKTGEYGEDQYAIDRSSSFGIQIKITPKNNPEEFTNLHILPSGYGIKETWETQSGTHKKVLDFVREQDRPRLETALKLASRKLAA